MTRQHLIEQLRRQVYGGFPADEAVITDNLVNQHITQGCAIAAKQCYRESIQVDAVGYVNNSFYTTFKSLAIVKDENFLFKITLPQIPVGIGENQGVDILELFDGVQNSYPVIWMSEKERGIQRGRRKVPNKLLAYQEGEFVYIESAMPLTGYTAKATMISGGNATDLTSTLNIPDDYIPIIVAYIQQQLLLEKNQPVDVSNDGLDAKITS